MKINDKTRQDKKKEREKNMILIRAECFLGPFKSDLRDNIKNSNNLF